MNFLSPRFFFKDPFFERGCKGKHYFQTSKLFCKNFSIFIFMLSLVKNSQLYQPPVFQMGVQRYALFFNFQIFFQKFFNFYFSASVFLRTLSLSSYPFFKWECKGTTFILTSKFFCTNFKQLQCTVCHFTLINAYILLIFNNIKDCYNFVKIPQILR